MVECASDLEGHAGFWLDRTCGFKPAWLMSEAACAESQSARSATLRDKNAELINLDQDIPEVSNLYGWACRAVVLAEDEDFYRLAPSSWQAGHQSRILRNKNADQVYIVPADSRKLSYWHTIPFSLSENSPVLNLCKRIPHQLP